MVRVHHFAAIAALVVSSLVFSADQAAANHKAGNCCVCPPPPIKVTLCVQPPCSCCAENIDVCVPGCCTEPPTVCWRSGFLGRQIATYAWPCCGYSVEVVVNRRGVVRVR